MTAARSLAVLAAEAGNRIGPNRDGAPVVQVPMQHLRFHPRNVRSNLGDLTALVESVRQEGILVPLMAEKLPGGGLQLLHGHRRWAAADLAGLRRVPVAIVPAHTPDEAIMLMLAENTGRATVEPGDLQRSVRALRAEFGWSVGAIAARLGVPEATINGWGAGRGLAQPARPASARPARTVPTRPPAPKLRPVAVHKLLGRLDAGEVDEAAVVAELRGWMGDWQPVLKPEATS